MSDLLPDDCNQAGVPGASSASDPDPAPVPNEATTAPVQSNAKSKDKAKSKSKSANKGKREALTTRIVRYKKTDPQRFYIVCGLAGLLGVVGIAGVAYVMTTPPPVRAQKPMNDGTINLETGTSSRVDNFIASHNEKLDATDREVRQLKDTIQSNQNQTRKQFDRLAKQQDTLMKLQQQLTEQLTQLSKQRAKVGSAGANTNSLEGQAESPSDIAFLDALKQDYARGLLLGNHARERIRQRLRDAGHDAPTIERLMPRMLAQIGVLYVGDVAEGPVTDKELQTLPETWRPIVPHVQMVMKRHAEISGRVLPEPSIARTALREKLPGVQTTKAMEMRLATIARVRQENLTDKQNDQMSRLAQLQKQRGIAHDDLPGLERFVHQQRHLLPGLTPGQHLAIVVALSQASADSTTVRRARMSPEDTILATQIVQGAMQAALADGAGGAATASSDPQARLRHMQVLQERGMAALNAYLAQRQLDMDRHARDGLVNGLVVKLLAIDKPEAKKNGTKPARQASASTSQAKQAGVHTKSESQASPVAVEQQYLHLGPIQVNERQAQHLAWLMVSDIARREPFDVATPTGAAAVIAMWKRSGPVAARVWKTYVDQPMGLTKYVNTVYEQLTVVGYTGERLGKNKLDLPGVPEAVLPLVRSVVVVDRLLDVAEQDEEGVALREGYIRLQKAVRERSPVVAGRLQVAEDVAADAPWERLAAVIQVVRPHLLSQPAARVQALHELLGSLEATLQEDIRTQLATEGHREPVDASAWETIARQLATVVPASIASHDDGRRTIAEVQSHVRADVAAYVTMTIAEVSSLKRTIGEYLRTYGHGVSARGGGTAAVLDGIRQWLPEQLALQLNGKTIKLSESVETGHQLASLMAPEVERQVVLEVIMTAVAPALRGAGKALAPELVETVLTQVRRTARSWVDAPFSVARIDQWKMKAQRLGMDQLSGRKPTQTRGPQRAVGQFIAQQNPGAPRLVFPAVRPMSGGSDLSVGLRTEQFQGRTIGVPATSYMSGVLVSGASLEVGGEGNYPVIIEGTQTFHLPSKGVLHVPQVRYIGQANPQAGDERLIVQIVSMSMRFPNNRWYTATVNGVVSDNLEGELGILGQFDPHVEKVLPASIASGALAGLGEALNENAQTTVITTGATTTETTNGDVWERALLGGTSRAANKVEEFIDTYKDDIKPTVRAKNGQPVTVILLEDVTFDDITDADWASLKAGSRRSGF